MNFNNSEYILSSQFLQQRDFTDQEIKQIQQKPSGVSLQGQNLIDSSLLQLADQNQNRVYQQNEEESYTENNKISSLQMKDHNLLIQNEKIAQQSYYINESNKEVLEKQLREGLAQLQISIDNLPEEILEKKEQIDALEKKGKVNQSSLRKKSLENLEILKSVYNQLEQLKNPAKIKDQIYEISLKKQLKDGLAEFEIQDVSQLQEEIQERKIVIQNLEKKGQQNKASERRKSLEKLEQLQSVFFQLDKLKSPQNYSVLQTQREQLQLEINDGFSEFEIKDVSQLQDEIQERKILIQNLEKKGQFNKANERRRSLEKLQHLQQVFIQLEKLTPPSIYSTQQTIREQLQLELNIGLAEFELQDVSQLQEEIQERKTSIQNLEKKGQQNKAYERRKSLEKLQHLHSLFLKIDQLKPLSSGSETLTKKKQLELELKSGLAEYEIFDVKQLLAEIEERKISIQNLKKKGQMNKASERKKSLERLEHLQSLMSELEKLKPPFNKSEHKTRKEQLEFELNSSLHVEQENFEFQQKDIQQRKYFIQNLEKTGQLLNRDYGRRMSLENQECIEFFSQELAQIKKTCSEDQFKQTRVEILNISDSSFSNEDTQQQSKQFSNYSVRNEQYEIIENNEIEKNNNQENELSSKSVSSNINLKDIQKNIFEIPEYWEKNLLQLMSCALQLQYANQFSESRSNQIGDKVDFLLNQFQSLQNRLKIEDLISQKVNEFLQIIEINIKSENLEQVIHQSERLLKELRPLNIREMKKLIKKTNEASELIKGQDILLFLGGTGAGKSTTIHFLAGSKMIEIETQVRTGKFLKYIGPDPKQIKNKALQNIKIGHQAQSETRYITPVLVNFQDIGIRREGSIVLCDAPGFGDTAGTEVDIANGIGIVQAIKHCKSVRPVILISSLSIGDKGEGIKKLAHVLVGLVDRISDKLNSFSYLFTKYPAEANIHIELLNIKNSVDKNEEEYSDKSFVSIFEDIIEKTEDEVKRINPLTDKPSKVINSLIKTCPILNPNGVFQFSITESSKAIIKEQIQLHQLSIISAAKRHEYILIEYKLNEMKFLMDNLNQYFIQQTYSECINYIVEDLNKNYRETIAQFNRCIINENKLTIEDLRQYKLLISQLQEAENLRKTHLGTQVVQTSSLIQHLLETVDNLSKEFDQQNLCSSSLKNNLNNIKLLSEEFPEIKPKYIILCQIIEVKIQNLVSSCQQIFNENDFSKLSDVLSNLKQYSVLFKNHLNVEQILQQYKKAGESLLRYLNQICNRVDSILRKEILDDKDIDQLKEAIQIIESAKDTFELKEHIKMEEVKMLNENLVSKIIKYFENINDKIDESFRNERENSFKEIEILVQQMGLIRKIQGVDSKTSEMYHKTIQGVLGYMQQLRRDADQLLNNLNLQPNENVNFSKIYRYLTGLQNAQWMNNIRSGKYEDIMKDITEDLVKHSLKLNERLIDLDFDLNHPENIQSALNLFNEIEAMRPLEKIISGLTQTREIAHQRVKTAIQKNFDFIQTTFNLENKAVYQLKQNLKQLQSIKSEYEEFNPERLYLSGQGFQTIESLNEEIVLKDDQYQVKINDIEDKKKNYEQLLQKLKETNQKYIELQHAQRNGPLKSKRNSKGGINANNLEFFTLLSDINCQSIQDVFLKIKETETEIAKLRDSEQTERMLNEIQRLQQIQAEYTKIQKSKIVSQEGQEFLKSKGYEGIKTIDLKIKNQIEIIKDMEQKDQEYAFTKLDGSVAESAFHFLEACKKIRWVKEDANNTFLKLNDFIVKYGDFMQQEMQTSYQKVQEITLKEINEVSGSAQTLAFFLQELCELQKYPKIFKLIKGKEKTQNWKNVLTNYFNTLSDDMCQMNIEKQDLRNKIKIVKALSQVDFFIGNEKYYNLYKQFQSSICNEFKEIQKRILELVEKNDFKMVSVELLEIEENPINERAIGQIKHNINTQVMELVESAKQRAIMIGKNLDIVTIKFIVDNFNKIESAKNHLGYLSLSTKQHSSSQGYLDESNQQIIEKELKEIQGVIANIITSYLESIEALLSSSDFYEAEEKREYINQVYQLMGRYGEKIEITQKVESLQNKIEGIVERLLNEYDQMEFSQYILKPPKQLLDNLQKVSSRNIKYTEFLNKMKLKIIEKVRKILQEIKESNTEQKKQLIQMVETGLSSIPDEIRSLLQNDLENCKKLINQKELGYQEDYDRAMSSGDLGIISQFMKKCKEDKMYCFYNIIQKDIIKQVQDCKEKINDLLKNESIKQVFQEIRKLSDIIKHFGVEIQGIQNTFIEVQSLIVNKLDKLIKFLLRISSFDNNEVEYEKGYDNFIMFVDYKNENATNKIFFGEDFDQKTENLYSKILEYFLENQDKFENNLKNYNIMELNEGLTTIKKWNQLLKKLKSYSEMFKIEDQSFKLLTQIVEKCRLYPQTIQQIAEFLRMIKQEILSFEFFSGFLDQRNEYYLKLNKKLKALQIVQNSKENLNFGDFDINSYEKECIPLIKDKLQKAVNLSIYLLENNKDQLSKKDYDIFNLQYDNMVSLEQNVKIQDIQPRKHIETIEDIVKQKVQIFKKQIVNSDNNTVAVNLIQMKVLSDNLPSFKSEIDKQIDDSLKNYMNQLKNNDRGQQNLGILATILESDENGVGLTIISEHSCFKGQAISIFNEQAQKHGIDYILKNIEGDKIDFKMLEVHFYNIQEQYQSLIKKYTVKLQKKNETQAQILEELISQIKLIPNGIKNQINKVNWDQSVRDKIPSLIAHIFALWTLLNVEYYNQMNESENRNNFLLQPHAGQIVSILRLLGIAYGEPIKKHFESVRGKDYQSVDELQNNLIEIKTGEGKSVTLAVASSIFALLGFDVSCACYSEYLSNRDYNDFLQIFESLGITQYIKYGPFNKICENIINERGEIREIVIDLISKDSKKEANDSKIISKRPRILLIDEVDVFFSKDFYGNIYNPLARLKDPTIQKLTNFIWENKGKSMSVIQLKESAAYKNCINRFKNWDFLIEEALKDMVSDSINFKHDYFVINDKIAYKEQDSISFGVNYGYKTLFAYYQEHENGRVSKNSLEENIFIGIRCGTFSYAQIPHEFKFIVGVTGTLKTLSEQEKQIVEQQYKINKATYIPSVFGQNKLSFAQQDDIYVENRDDYFKRLREQIDKKIKRNKSYRAVLVFFETKQKLLEFYNSLELAPIKGNVQIITEEVSTSLQEKIHLIKRATTSNQISLLTRSFGRGTDFVCRDQQVLNNGGVHVIQAFFSNEVSEEIQIKGRCARQGEDGSFNLVLLDEDLEKFLGTNFRKELAYMRMINGFYNQLSEKRTESQSLSFNSNRQFFEEADKQHNLSQQFVEKLHSIDLKSVKQFLADLNKGANQVVGYTRILCLVDATSSMGRLLRQAKYTVKTMIQRATQILNENHIPEDSFQLQFAVYRDYDCKIEGILQSSPWESKAYNLYQFLEKIEPFGGGDYEEAIEIALQYANQQNEIQSISSIILIGDAPAKTQDQIQQYRKQYGGESYWKKSQFQQKTFYKEEIEKLKKNKVPIHSFYLHNGAKSNFEEISINTGGRCEKLDVSSPQSSHILTDIVTEQILQSVGQAKGKGDQLVKAYQKLFAKCYI